MFAPESLSLQSIPVHTLKYCGALQNADVCLVQPPLAQGTNSRQRDEEQQLQEGTTTGVSTKPPYNHKLTNLLHHGLNPYVDGSSAHIA